MKKIDRKCLRNLILQELKYLQECGCKDEVDDPATLIPAFPYGDIRDHSNMNMVTDYELIRKDNALNSKCPGSYAKTADQLILNSDIPAQLIDLLMQKSGSTCPASSAKALNDIMTIYLQNQEE